MASGEVPSTASARRALHTEGPNLGWKAVGPSALGGLSLTERSTRPPDSSQAKEAGRHPSQLHSERVRSECCWTALSAALPRRIELEGRALECS